MNDEVFPECSGAVGLLCPEEAEDYQYLKTIFSQKSLPLRLILRNIRQFACRGDERDQIRCLACGVCWLPGDRIALNLRVLRSLASRPYSSLKSSIYSLGFISIPNFSCDLFNVLPVLEHNPYLLREWRVYVLRPLTPQPIMQDLEGLETASMGCAVSPCPTLGPMMSAEDLRKNEMKMKLEDFFDDPFCCTPKFLYEEFEYSVCN
jgi:hypothetical protein